MRNRFQTLHIVFRFLGSTLIVLGLLLLLPLAVTILDGEARDDQLTVLAFALPSAVSILLGLISKKIFRKGDIGTIQAMLICSLGWLAFSAIGALPFVIAIRASYLDAFFETMSGFTTTGITLFSGLDGMPKSILFWRSLTQWVGGLGILTFFLGLSFQGGVAHRLFGAESHKIESGRPAPGLAHTLKILWGIYLIFTVLITAALYLAGMSAFDSICHTCTVLSTGGFSPHDASIGYYRLAGFPHFVWIEYIILLGMVLGGTNFLVHYRLLKGNGRALFDTTEMRYWWGLIGGFILLILAERAFRIVPWRTVSFDRPGFWTGIEENFRAVVFQVISIITTTGYATKDIAGPFFGEMARQLFLVMMVIGACAGSTGGGLKVIRVVLLTKAIRREVFRLRSPAGAITNIIIDKKPVKVEDVRRAGALFFAWVVLIVVGGAITAVFSHLNGYSALSGMFSALGNIGPCYITGSEMAQLHPIVKITYIFGMLAGRLEILPVLLLFSPKAWQA